LRPQLQELLSGAESLTRSFCRPAVLDELIRDHLEARRNNEKALWGLMNLEIFLRTFRPALT
jgi:hypothetical protein